MEQTAPETAPAAVSPLRALIILVALVPIIGILIALGYFAGVSDYLFAGFIFILYWMGVKGGASSEYAPALAGSLGGVGLAYLLHSLPNLLGTTGGVLAGLGLALSIYLLIRGQFPLLINNAFMLQLTVGASIAFDTTEDYAAAAVSIALAATYAGALTLLGKIIPARSKAATTTAGQ